MKTLIDNQIYENQIFGGISRYFNMLEHGNGFIQKMKLSSDQSSKNKNFYQKIESKLSRAFNNETQILATKYDFYNSQIRDLHYDVFHPTYYDNYFLSHLKKPLVVTVHDMIHEKYAEYFESSLDSINKRRLCEKADKIIAVSKTTKKDIIDIFQVPEERIKVIYHGTNFDSISAVKPNLDFQGKRYLLFTGNRINYKNFLTFLIAVSPILKQYKDLQLICSGSPFNAIEKRWIKNLNIENNIKGVFCKTDSELVYLYQNAECFIFPSVYEGFGFPILEAFACNCPIVSSDGGSLKEIGGDAAIYFNPKDIKDIRDSINNVISDSTLKKELIKMGRIRLKDFSEDKCRLETNLVYSRVR